MMEMAIHTAPVFLHPFEKAGLGKAPFRLMRTEAKQYRTCPGAPVQPGGMCDYCGTALYNIFWIRSADGREFRVGCECVRHAAGKGERVLAEVEVAARKMKREAAARSLRARLDAIYARLDSDPSFLTDAPHPKGWTGKTLRDWADWMFAHAGAAGATKAARAIEKHLKSKGE